MTLPRDAVNVGGVSGGRGAAPRAEHQGLSAAAASVGRAVLLVGNVTEDIARPFVKGPMLHGAVYTGNWEAGF